jgi:8-oxo-dGTP pyrophosphatase MutT (NUDIX family)
MLKSWPVISTEKLLDTRVFSLVKRQARSPRSGELCDFFLMEAPHWVNIVPITRDGRLVLVRQFRQGVDELTLEIPGGMMDPEDPSPEHAARRELLEETGYTAGPMRQAGWVEPNPALQTNRCYTFVAEGLHAPGPLQPDGSEDLEVVHIPLAEVPEYVRSGRIRHSLVIAAFALSFGLGASIP